MYGFAAVGPELCGYVQEESLQAVLRSRKELGGEATWSLSSSKEGNGVAQLRDDSTETFWQSDGAVPHTVTLQFLRKTRVGEVALYLDFKSDESYAPEVVQVRGGLHPQDLREIARVSLKEPVGWIRIPLSSTTSLGEKLPFVYSSHFQIVVLQMHSSGKDTHVRQVKVFGAEELKGEFASQDIAEHKTLQYQTLR